MKKKYTIPYYFSHREEKGNNIARGDSSWKLPLFKQKQQKRNMSILGSTAFVQKMEFLCLKQIRKNYVILPLMQNPSFSPKNVTWDN